MWPIVSNVTNERMMCKFDLQNVREMILKMVIYTMILCNSLTTCIDYSKSIDIDMMKGLY